MLKRQVQCLPHNLDSQRNDITMDFTTVLGKHLHVSVPISVFARLSQRLGSNYKADCWIVVRCSEVEPLSAETVQQYINMMVGEIVCQENDRRTQITSNIEVRFA